MSRMKLEVRTRRLRKPDALRALRHDQARRARPCHRHGPEAALFDEPSAGLDPVASAELDELILTLRDAMNMTIVVVTHELESAFKIADSITVLDHGRILMSDRTAAVRASEHPRIRALLDRTPRDDSVDADEYMERLTREIN